MWWIDPVTTLLVGVLGFGGVILTIKSNGKQARQLEIDRNARRAKQLREALYAELRMAVKALGQTAAMERKDNSDKGDTLLIPKNKLNPLYYACVADLPSLSAEDISRIIECHGILESYLQKLSTFCPLNEQGSHYVATGHFHDIVPAMAKGCVEAIEELLEQVDQEPLTSTI